MTQTPEARQQQTLKEGKLMARMGVAWDAGLGVITPGHFSFQAHGGTWLSLFGLLGGLLRMALPVRVKVTVPLTSITAIGRGKIGLLRDVFFIEATDGKTYWFRLDYQPWLEALTNALQTHAKVTLTQKSDERWEVRP